MNIHRPSPRAHLARGLSPGTFGACPKVSYDSEAAAWLALVTIALMGHGPNRPVRAYACDQCDCWHLTKRAG